METISKPKLVRITTVPLSLEKLLEGQLQFMSAHYQITAISSEKDRLKRYGESEAVATFYIPLTRKITPLQDIWTVWKLYKFLKRECPHIVHTHTPKAGIIGMFASYLAKVPNRLHTVAGLPLMEATGVKRKLLNWVEKRTYAFATKIYPNSKGLSDFIISKKFTSKEKLKIIGEGSSNGIDTNYFSSAHFSEEQLINKKNELNIPLTDFVFVFVGRIVKDKGINEMVSAFAILHDKYPDCSLLLVGPFENDLDPVSKQTEHQILHHPKIITTGFQKEVRVYFALSNALVFPSYREGFPNVVLQAGAMDLPSIVSNINGCNEIIKEGVNGLIHPPKDVKALYIAMEKMLNDKKLVLKLKNNARKKITGHYERKEIWNTLLNEYQKM